MEFSRCVIGIDGTWGCCPVVARMKKSDYVGQLSDTHGVVERRHRRRALDGVRLSARKVGGGESMLRLDDSGDELTIGFYASNLTTEFKLHLGRGRGSGEINPCDRMTMVAIQLLECQPPLFFAAFGKPEALAHARRAVFA